MKSERDSGFDKAADGNRRETAGKKRYRTPELIEYGSVAKLTQSSAGSGADGGGNASKMKSCL